MDFLTLVKRLASESGTELESKITSVAVPPAVAYGQTTEHRTRLVNWVRQAWLEIQEDQTQWDFMIERGTMPLAQGQVKYDIKALAVTPCDPACYDHIVPFVAPLDSRYIWIVDGDQVPSNPQICYYTPAEHFFGDRDRFNILAGGQPSRYSIDRDDCIVFDAAPSLDSYYIEFAFKKVPQELLIDTDVPEGLPLKFHMVIIYKALVYYSMFDEADKQVKRAMKLYKDWLNKLRGEELGEFTLVGTRS